ncbi:TcmI family type II polyketide cyclase [Nocardia sp. NPDC052316]|uniref:TcmI family type II polyketide cyclase n=1 Tax=Nocardia sp. NPDC052316 TaxID=3364329 RepID=UPI0037C5DC84
MFSSLIVAKMDPASAARVAAIFADFDSTDMPGAMGTRRRELFTYRGLYFHLQDFESDHGADRIESAKQDARFVRISADLRPYITAYDPNWRSPADAMATRFYHWAAS